MLKLVQTNWGQFDLALIDEEPTDVVDMKTIIYAILFTDQQAPQGRVADPHDQRGWWFAPDDGSGLWYLRRQSLSAAARLETINMVKAALEVELGMSNVEVSDATAAGNVSSVELEVSGIYYGTSFHLVIPSWPIDP